MSEQPLLSKMDTAMIPPDELWHSSHLKWFCF